MAWSIEYREASTFPLSVSGRFLLDAAGAPFLLNGEAAWSLAVQCTHAQIDTYLGNRAAKGFNAIIVQAIAHSASSQTPAYRNAQSGADPFTTMTNFASPNTTYWQTVDYVVNGAKSRGIAVILFPAYFGFDGGSQGWASELSASSDADLQTYGAWLANRYTQGNVIWGMGGDWPGDASYRAKQWNIVTGIRSVRTTDVITVHPSRADATGYSVWSGYTGSGFNLNTIYIPTTNIADDIAATAYAQGMPFFMVEGGYEGEAGTAASIRMAAYTTLLSGGIGNIFGNNPLWGFGEPTICGGLGAASALATSLDTTGAVQMAHFRNLFAAYPWQKLAPKTDTSLVTSSLGTSGTTSRVCPALASDGTFAMIWTPSVNLTVNMAAFSIGSVRGRWFNPTDGTYSAAAGSPFANSGSQSFTAPGERVLVLD